MNPNLTKPTFNRLTESQRVMLTRYRTGSHNLRIEKDRFLPNSKREERLCMCGADVQTIKHVLLECNLLNDIRTRYNIEDVENGIMNDSLLLEMEDVLKIK